MFKVSKLWPILALTVLALLFSVTPSFSFLYDGLHWDDSDLPVRWEINQDGTADCTGEFDAIRAGYQTWENVSGSYFSETYLGTTSRGLSYPTRDGYNVVSWGDSEPGGSVIAVCWTWYDTATLEIVECDIEFQNDIVWSSTGEAGKFDVQNIATHEFGHTLLLGDLYYPTSEHSEKTMYGWSSEGETKKRTLHQDDIDGIRYIYPESGNQPPNTPSVPTGPSSGSPGVSYSFTATTTDPDGDQIAFKFDWGDGIESGWTSFVNSGGSASLSHSWSGQMTYEVKAKAKDIYGGESAWSAGHDIVIGQPPATPSFPSGPDSGMRDVSYSFTAITTDPDGDQIAFKFDWGDGSQSGWTSFVNSGGSASLSHSWSGEGTYQVRVKAKDAYDAESGWSAAHSIIIRIILLQVDPSSLDFGELGKGSSKTMTFRAYNAGAGTLSGSVTVNRDWMTVNPSGFEGNDNTIYITVETEELTESLSPYMGAATVISNGGTETIEVSLLVIPSGIVAYPNPFSPSAHTNLVFWGNSVPYMKIRILNLSGELVKVLQEKYGNSMVSWDGKNEQGNLVARGIYIFVMENFSGRIAVVK
ncbi:hypothetical protein CEE34_00965 [Candidatus Aerophobetes bacterium Ae_b3a]|nr:MAG: hypothetical protein CEE34_00965 [Candidatus Aerophobetes bacterium Ae_b3a]